MVKGKRLAYDGRGNAVAQNKEELSSVVACKQTSILFRFLLWILKTALLIWIKLFTHQDSLTSLPVFRVPIKTQSLLGLDSLLSIVQVSVLTVLSFKIQIEVNAVEI